MKLTLFIAFFIAFTSSAFAQNPRIETLSDRRTETYAYKKTGGDSIRFTILGKNDTVQITTFYRNGQRQKYLWKEDSTYFFSDLGQLERKIYFKKGVGRSIYFTDYAINGQVSRASTYENGIFQEKIYRKDGLLLTTIYEKETPSVSSRREARDRNNLLISSNRIDSLHIGSQEVTRHYDSVFYANGRLQAALHAEYKMEGFELKRESLGAYYFNPDGSIFKTVKADSLQLIPFKDNVDCYYGLKNKRGDTVVKPRFDHIEDVAFGYRAAYIGNSGILLNPEGAPMTPPSARLSAVYQLLRYRPEIMEFNPDRKEDDLSKRLNNLTKIPTDYFSFADGEQHGIMRHDGTLVMAPQYHRLSGYYYGDGDYFGFLDVKGDSVIQSGYLNRQGKPLFQDRFKWVIYLKDDYFLINKSDDLTNWHGRLNTYWLLNGGVFLGLANGRSESVILEPKYSEIRYLHKSNLLLTKIETYDEKTEKVIQKHGVFNPRTQKWIVDTSRFFIEEATKQDYNSDHFVLKNIDNNKYGIVDTTGKFVVPVSFDSIGRVDEQINLFWVKKGNKYQILSLEKGKMNLHKPTYDFLANAHFYFRHNEERQIQPYFIAKRNNKWGVVDADDRTVKPFVYAYASTRKDGKFVLVKDNQAACFSGNSLPNETTVYADFMYFIETRKKLSAYPLADKADRIFFINDTGRVVIPPQYKPLRDYADEPYALVEDTSKNKKIIIYGTGQVIDYPFDYEVQKWQSQSRIFVVRDTSEVSFGAVSFDGQLVTKCENYGIALTETDESVYFVKRDTPVLQRYTAVFENGKMTPRWNVMDVNGDTLNATDNNWMLYDATGKPLSDAPFRFPIDFKNGVGIGMKGEDFSLYKPDGSILTPFRGNTEGGFPNKYRNIRRDPKTGFYALFRNQGLTPTMMLAKNNGQIIIGSGRYDGISRFYGPYALVSSQGLIGLVDSFGQEMIAPQDLRIYKNHFMDSLDMANKKLRQQADYVYDDITALPIDLVTHNPLLNPDSLDISAEKRAVLWNLMLEKALPYTLGTASDALIPRNDLVANVNFVTIQQHRDMSFTPLRLIVEENTMAFGWQKSLVYAREGQEFHNFYRRNNRWEALILNDLLNIQGEKRNVFNEALIKKVKALKDAKIDCSNTSGFITAVENRFMLTKQGVDFCFNSEENDENLVIVSFTQAELMPFLKMSVWRK